MGERLDVGKWPARWFLVNAGGDIQAAIDAANTAGGGVVVLGPGTHAVATALVPKSKVTIAGLGMMLARPAQAPFGYLPLLQGASNVNVFEVTAATHDWGLEGVAIQAQGTGDCVEWSGSGATNGLKIHGCQFYAASGACLQYAPTGGAPSDWDILNTLFEDTGGAQPLVDFNQSGGGGNYWLRVQGCRFKTLADSCIKVGPAGSTADHGIIVIQGNVFWLAASSAGKCLDFTRISSVGNYKRILVSGNFFNGNDAADQYGIIVDRGQGFSITGNFFMQFAGTNGRPVKTSNSSTCLGAVNLALGTGGYDWTSFTTSGNV